MYNLGEKLKEIRKEMKLNQEEFAEKIGLNSRSTYQRLESGDVKVSIDEAKEIAKNLGVELPDLLPELLSFTNQQNQGHVGVMFGNIIYYSSPDQTQQQLINENTILKERVQLLEDQIRVLQNLLDKLMLK